MYQAVTVSDNHSLVYTIPGDYGYLTSKAAGVTHGVRNDSAASAELVLVFGPAVR